MVRRAVPTQANTAFLEALHRVKSVGVQYVRR